MHFYYTKLYLSLVKGILSNIFGNVKEMKFLEKVLKT